VVHMSADVGAILAWVMWIAIGLIYLLCFPTLAIGSYRYASEFGWCALAKRNHLPFQGPEFLETRMIENAVLAALEQWRRLWPALWPDLLRAEFRDLKCNSIGIDGVNQWTIDLGGYATYHLRVYVTKDSRHWLEIRRALPYWSLLPFAYSFLAGLACYRLSLALLGLFGLIIWFLWDVGGAGYLIVRYIQAITNASTTYAPKPSERRIGRGLIEPER
jgi:hypothetical protein